MQLVNLLTELSWVNAGNSFGADGGACLMVSRPCCFSWLQWSVGSYLSGSQLLQFPCAGSVVVLMKCCPLREQLGSVFFTLGT